LPFRTVLVYVTFLLGTGWKKKHKGVSAMGVSGDVCTCGGFDTTRQEAKTGLCAVRGKRMKRVEELSDSLIEATFEILAEEGAIWSGAR
jgi:hypothetical protein